MADFAGPMFHSAAWQQWLYRAKVYLQYESRALGFVYLPRLLRLVEWQSRQNLRRQVADPGLRRNSLPATPSAASACWSPAPIIPR